MALPIAAVVAGALIDPTTFGNEVVTALNAAPRGTVAFASATANQTGITTVVDATSLSTTWTAVAGRRYRISAQCKANSSVIGDIIKVSITDSGGTEITHSEIVNQSTVAGQSMSCAAVIVPGAGSKTYKARIQRSGGTGTVLLNAGATYPAYILVEDIGT